MESFLSRHKSNLRDLVYFYIKKIRDINETIYNCKCISCLVDGGFSAWTRWTSCSKSCGRGIRTRDRKCNSPFADHGGKPCSGTSHEQQTCKIKDCPGNYNAFLLYNMNVEIAFWLDLLQVDS